MRTDQLKTLLRLLLWGSVVTLLVLRYFDLNPITLEDEVEGALPTEAPLRTAGEVLVVVDDAVIARSAEADSFRQLDWSYAWLNTVEQEFGPHTLLTADKLRTTDLTPWRFVILTPSVAGQGGDNDLVTHLKTYVQSGGVLILERPSGLLRETFAADGRGGVRTPKLLSHVKDLPTPYDAYLKSMPLNTSYIGSSGPAEGAVTWLAMDGVPVLYSRPMTRGHAVVVEFNWGRQLTSLQQGRPRDDFAVVNRYPGLQAPALESNDLVTDERLLDNPVPYADILEKYLVLKVLGEARPAIGMWGFKNQHQGALLMTHDEESMGDKATWMAAWEQEHGFKSTYFVIPSGEFTQAGVRTLRGHGADVQLHWNRPQDDQGIFEPLGFWKIHPFQKARSLQEQRDALAAIHPGGEITANRNHILLWSDDYTGVFRQLAAVGVKVDSTYGPDKNGRGYLFGTGLPFWALDTNGLPLPVMEHPFLVAETLGGVDGRFMLQLFADSLQGTHQAINLLFHPNAYSWMPSVELFDLWTATYALAVDHDHWITTISGFHRFWGERRGASLNTTWTVGRVKSDNKPTGPGDDELLKPGDENFDAGPMSIKIEAQVSGDGHSVTAPAMIQGRRLRDARRGADGESGEALELGATDVLGQRLHLVPLRKGFNTITLNYR